jgi:hypothetical protein
MKAFIGAFLIIAGIIIYSIIVPVIFVISGISILYKKL